MGFRFPPLCCPKPCNRTVKTRKSRRGRSRLCWLLVGQSSTRRRSVLAVPWGACQAYLTHRMDDEQAQEVFNVKKKKKKKNCQTLSRFLLNVCKLEFDRSSEWPNLGRFSQGWHNICSLHQGYPCKISNPCLKAWSVWSISCKQK